MSCSNVPQDVQEHLDVDGQQKEETLMPRKPKLAKATCIRCRDRRSSVIAGTAAFCKDCFKAQFPNKILKSISSAIAGSVSTGQVASPPAIAARKKGNPNKGPNLSAAPIKRAQPQNGNVLIALSGGPGSLAMVDVLATNAYFGEAQDVLEVGIDARGRRKAVWPRAWTCHVDFSSVAVGTISQTEKLQRHASANGLRFVSVKAEDAFDPCLQARLSKEFDGPLGQEEPSKANLMVDLTSSELELASFPPSTSRTPLEQLTIFLSSLPPTSRPAFLSYLLDSLINAVASVLPGISHILLGDTSSRQAQNIIASTASGAGWGLPLNLASSTLLPSMPSVVRIKPMKQTLLNEVAYWCYLRNIETFSLRNWNSIKGTTGEVLQAGGDARGKSAGATLESLTEQFIAGLGSSHPSTVSTIARTGEKLMFRGNTDAAQGSKGLCPLCQLPAEPSSLQWKSRTALTSFPHKRPPLEMRGAAEVLPRREGTVNMAQYLCYGCLTALTAPLSLSQMKRQEDGPVQMPLWVQHRVNERVTQEAMRSEISTYLITDDA